MNEPTLILLKHLLNLRGSQTFAYTTPDKMAKILENWFLETYIPEAEIYPDDTVLAGLLAFSIGQVDWQKLAVALIKAGHQSISASP